MPQYCILTLVYVVLTEISTLRDALVWGWAWEIWAIQSEPEPLHRSEVKEQWILGV